MISGNSEGLAECGCGCGRARTRNGIGEAGEAAELEELPKGIAVWHPRPREIER